MFFKKLISLILIGFIVLGPISPTISYAEEGETTEATEAVTPPPTETPQPEQASEPTVTEETPTPSVSPEPTITNAPEDMTNVASVSAQVDANSTTGSNSQEGGDDAGMSTGDAQSEAQGTNELNTTQSNPDMLTNEASLSATVNAESKSGDNSQTDINHDAGLETGDSISSAALLNIINTSMIDSELQTFLLDLLKNNTTGYINLVDLWNITNAHIDSLNAIPTENTVTNDATVNVSLSSTAVSGDNTQQDVDHDATMLTGNAYAAANMINLLNTKLVNSHLFFAIINVFDDYEGDIILPNIYRFTLFGGQPDGSNSTNFADVQNNINSNANSGDNSQGANTALMQTGNSTAIANNSNYLNLIYQNITWYYLLLNNAGNWTGNIIGYDDPNSTSTYADISTYLHNLALTVATTSNGDTTQNATLVTNANANALSGHNIQTGVGGTAAMQTGNSVAIANVLNFVNTSFYNSNIFMPIINIFGNWKGNLVFAYPDVTTGISSDKQVVKPGDTVNYTVSFGNKGLDKAYNDIVTITLPAGEHLTGSSQPFVKLNDATYQLISGTLNPNEQKNASFQTVIDNPIQDNLITQATIQTTDQEMSTANNSSSVSKLLASDNGVGGQANLVSANVNEEAPILTVESSNNVATYVYPKDVVTFTAVIRNSNNQHSKNTAVYQILSDANGNVLTTNAWNIGDLNPGESRKITFGLTVPPQTVEGMYTSMFYAVGASTSGQQGTSNQSYSAFRVAGNTTYVPFSLGGTVNAQEPLVKSVLGVSSHQNINQAKAIKMQKDWLFYILITLISVFWLYERNYRKRLERELLKNNISLEGTSKEKSQGRNTLKILGVIGFFIISGGIINLNVVPTSAQTLDMPTMPSMPTTPALGGSMSLVAACSPTPTPTTPPTSTPVPSATPTMSVPTSTPGQGPTETPGPTATPTPGPTATPGPGPSATPGPGIGGNPSILGLVTSSTTSEVVDNYNPLVEGIENAYGKILGAKTHMPQTGVEGEQTQDKLPSGNKLLQNEELFISKIGLHSVLYQSTSIGSELIIGDKEVLEKKMGNGILMYGHNTPEVFGRLSELQPNDTFVHVQNGKTDTYKVISVENVSQEYHQALETEANMITLVSCDLYNPYLRVVVKAIKI